MKPYPNLMDPDVQACPYELYQRLRQEAPVYRMPQSGFYLVTGYDLCREIIRQPDTFISGVSPMALGSDGIPADVLAVYEDNGWVPKASCSTSDPPRHTAVRAILAKFFTMAKVRALTPDIRAIANALVDDFAGDDSCEFVQAFSHPLPMMVIARMLGVASADLETFKAWSDAIVEPFGMMITPEREVECAKLVVEMQHFFKAEIEQRRARPVDDILSMLAQEQTEDGEPLPLDELLTIVTIDLLASGNETTTAGISSGMLKLAEQPEIWRALQTDRSLIPTFVEEVLRLESPAQGMFREVTQDTRIGSTLFRKGDVLSLRFGAANRDETVFHDADKVVLDREKAGKHLAFGVGRHHCVGAPLARQELIVSFEVLLERLQSVALTQPDMVHKYTPSFFGRNLEELKIAYSLCPVS